MTHKITSALIEIGMIVLLLAVFLGLAYYGLRSEQIDVRQHSSLGKSSARYFIQSNVARESLTLRQLKTQMRPDQKA